MVIIMADSTATQTRTPAPRPEMRPLTRSSSAAHGGPEWTPERIAAAKVGRAIAGCLKLDMELLRRPAEIHDDAEKARTAVCTELLECVPDMETLQRAGKQPELVKKALGILDANQKRFDGAGEIDPQLRVRARALLGHVEARHLVERLITSTELDDTHRRRALAHALGEVSLLLGMDKDDELASAALDTVMAAGFDGQSAKPWERRAAQAAMLMAGPRDVVQIGLETAEEARENLASLVGNVAAAKGSGKRWDRIRDQAVLELAEAYHDVVVLDAARRQGLGRETDESLIRAALGKVIERPPTNAKLAAAEMMRAKLEQE